MKRRNADCGKIRRPIKKNKIAEQIGSNTLLYVKFLLLWALVITADFLLEFRFEFLWPFWLLLRSVYDSFKYKGLAFSVLFVCIAITSDLVCLFFIPVQWLFFVASTYVWVQYVWHTDKGICLPTIILWILFIYLEAWIRWKDSRNLPHLDLCRPFAAHCIGYPVVTIGFGFKSYVGYRIRQRKQREVAKDNDFYMQLLQEALPKDESTVLDQTTSSEGADQQQQKELIVVPTTVPCTIVNSNLSTSSSSTSSSRSDTSHHNHHNHHHHHHHNHQQQQQQQQQQVNNSKNAQNHKSSSNSSIAQSSGGHANGHVSSGNASSTATSCSSMNGGLNHQLPTGQNSSKHRKSLDKESSGSNSSFSSSTSSTSNGVTKPNGAGGGGGVGGAGAGNNYSYHQTSPMLQQGSTGSNTSFTAVTTTTSSITAATNTSSNSSSSTTTTSMVTVSTKECAVSCAHVNGSLRNKDTKDGFPGASTATAQQYGRKDGDRDTCTSDFSSSSSANRPADNGTLTHHPKLVANGKQNGHVAALEQQGSQLAGGMNGATESSPTAGLPVTPVVETKSGRAGRKNRLKQQQKAAEQQLANSGSTMLKIFATLGLASTVTTTLTTTTSSTGAASSAVNSSTAEGSTVASGSKTAAKAAALAGSSSSEANMAGPGNASAAAADASQPSGGTAANKPSANGFAVAPSAAPVVMVQKVCESCPRLEGDLKKVRAELAAQRQTENEMRQKYDSTTGSLKGCLQKTQKEYDELQNRYQELSNQRQQERQSLQTVERRLGEERRLRQSLEAQLSNERKHRKQAEERISRAECGEACLAKKRQMQLELDKLKHDLMSCEDAKHLAEKQTRTFEQEMRKFELQLRNRESQQNTDVLMSALAAMQDKNATLEKNLSAETRVKMDLFSALGGTRRELDIATCTLRAKEKEILDLNAKIVQMLALMPNDSLCLSGPVGTGTGQDGGPGASMVRLADAPQLLPQQLSSGLNGMNGGVGGGPGGQGGGGGGGGSGSGQQPSPMSHMVLNGQPLMGPLGGGLGVLTSTMTTVSSPNSVCPPPGVSLASLAPGSGGNVGAGGQLVQMQGANQGNGNCPSGLDPNATVYTPKSNGGMVGGAGGGGGVGGVGGTEA
ncbi:macoilin-1-like isoform X1 [Anopheles albimanus]|nr:macoilin-1-like isoform X1 [Anopheles albimanus]XP_035793523.1 macoilin-1-like isoform X1 [Anopheles albimanus]XP_035793524.1 macoilin-1-like isoform X1 [Anopheles albimanus]XP_035793525.1 macoilin-1-like isoform X1 [Anopheles albimanus]